MLPKELERAAKRNLCRPRLIVGARVAVESVPAGIDVDRHVGPRLPDLLDITERDAGIDVAKMQHGRRLRNLVRAGNDLAAVISDRASQAAQPRCRVECQRTAQQYPTTPTLPNGLTKSIPACASSKLSAIGILARRACPAAMPDGS